MKERAACPVKNPSTLTRHFFDQPSETMSVHLFLKANWFRAKGLLAATYPPLVILTPISCTRQFAGASDIVDTKLPNGRKSFGSVNVTINVGQTEGKFAGKLLYRHYVLDAKSYDPNTLMLSLNNGASVVHTPDGTPRQITTNEALTDIVPVCCSRSSAWKTACWSIPIASSGGPRRSRFRGSPRLRPPR